MAKCVELCKITPSPNFGTAAERNPRGNTAVLCCSLLMRHVYFTKRKLIAADVW